MPSTPYWTSNRNFSSVVSLGGSTDVGFGELVDYLVNDPKTAHILLYVEGVRDARPGVKFADAELFGIPHRVVVSDRGIAAGKLEYRHRRAEASEEFPGDRALEFLRGRLAAG